MKTRQPFAAGIIGLGMLCSVVVRIVYASTTAFPTPRYVAYFGWVHYPALFEGVIYSLPLSIAAMIVSARTTARQWAPLVIAATVVMLSLDYFLAQEFKPHGETILLSSRRLSRALPVVLLPIGTAVWIEARRNYKNKKPNQTVSEPSRDGH
jgi:hypothetical protein